MSLIPFFNDWYVRPSRLVDQHFGVGLHDDDLLSAFVPGSLSLHHGHRHPYLRHWQSLQSQLDSGSTVSSDKDRFQVSLDVQQFRPEEVSVKVTGDNVITVEGKHEEKEDEHGFISRQFVRRYVLPKGHDISKCISKLSNDGVLTITAPKEVQDTAKSTDIPITFTNKPHKIQASGDAEKKAVKDAPKK